MEFFNQETKQKLIESPKKLKQSTITSYETLLKRLYRDALDKHTFNVALLKTKREKIQTYIMGDEINLNIKRNMLNAIINLLNLTRYEGQPIVMKYVKMYRKIADEANKERSYKGVSEDEKNNMVSSEEIDKLFNNYRKVVDALNFDWKNDLAFLFFAFLKYLPVLRSQDYVSLVIVRNSKESKNHDNFINIKESVIVINQYKTVKSHGTRTIDIPNELLKIIVRYYNKSNTNLLFPKKSDPHESMTVSGFAHFLNGLFGRKVSTQVLRQSYVSELHDSNIKISQRKKIANVMAHSLETQDKFYGKYSTRNN
jgi:integrase